MRNNDPTQPSSVQQLQQALETVLRSRQAIAVELRKTAANLSGRTRRQSLVLSRWFEQPTTADDVLQRSPALAICLPLLKPAARGTISTLDIEEAVASALNLTRRSLFQSRPFIADLAYPLVLVLLCSFFWLAFAVFLAPLFEQMFNEFELMLPPATSAVIGLARATRQWGIAALSLFVLLFIAFLAAQYARRRRHQHPRRSRLAGGWFSGTRAAWADWAWHVALLLDAGLSQPDAISWAGRASNQWIGETSQSWAEQIRQGRKPVVQAMYRGRPPGHLLRYALQMDDLADQAELLHEVAAIDWHRSRNRSRWWLWWITPMTVCCVGAIIGLIFSALFLPLVELIAGLGG